MIKERMIELILLNQLFDYMNSLGEEAYAYMLDKYDFNKIESRSKELTDEFMKDYVKDTSE